MSQQLRLLPAPKPLTERLGAAFFRSIPRLPGVYRMFDEAGVLLYVGQCKRRSKSAAGGARKVRHLPVRRERFLGWEVKSEEFAAR